MPLGNVWPERYKNYFMIYLGPVEESYALLNKLELTFNDGNAEKVDGLAYQWKNLLGLVSSQLVKWVFGVLFNFFYTWNVLIRYAYKHGGVILTATSRSAIMLVPVWWMSTRKACCSAWFITRDMQTKIVVIHGNSGDPPQMAVCQSSGWVSFCVQLLHTCFDLVWSGRHDTDNLAQSAAWIQDRPLGRRREILPRHRRVLQRLWHQVGLARNSTVGWRTIKSLFWSCVKYVVNENARKCERWHLLCFVFDCVGKKPKSAEQTHCPEIFDIPTEVYVCKKTSQTASLFQWKNLYICAYKHAKAFTDSRKRCVFQNFFFCLYAHFQNQLLETFWKELIINTYCK